jgi:hypothetical protein
MQWKLRGLICDAAGAVNEDAAGYLMEDGSPSAAWVIDGVTGINDGNHYDSQSDAAWFARQVDLGLRRLLPRELSLADLLAELVRDLQESNATAAPPDHDPPACCLVLVRRQGNTWSALRIGDSTLLVLDADGELRQWTDVPLKGLEDLLLGEAERLRRCGCSAADISAHLRSLLRESRRTRNRPHGYGILEADPRCLDWVQYMEFDTPRAMLLCTDGYYRLVDLFHRYDAAGILATAIGKGPEVLLTELRQIESSDPGCLHFPRLKPRDDATALCIVPASLP